MALWVSGCRRLGGGGVARLHILRSWQCPPLFRVCGSSCRSKPRWDPGHSRQSRTSQDLDKRPGLFLSSPMHKPLSVSTGGTALVCSSSPVQYCSKHCDIAIALCLSDWLLEGKTSEQVHSVLEHVCCICIRATYAHCVSWNRTSKMSFMNSLKRNASNLRPGISLRFHSLGKGQNGQPRRSLPGHGVQPPLCRSGRFLRFRGPEPTTGMPDMPVNMFAETFWEMSNSKQYVKMCELYVLGVFSLQFDEL